MSLKKLFYDDFTRAKAIIHNIFGNLGEKRDSLGIEELIKWIFELSTGCLIPIILFIACIFPIFRANILKTNFNNSSYLFLSWFI